MQLKRANLGRAGSKRFRLQPGLQRWSEPRRTNHSLPQHRPERPATPQEPFKSSRQARKVSQRRSMRSFRRRGYQGLSGTRKAYNDTEVAAVAGNQYTRISDGTQRCYTSSWAQCGSNPVGGPYLPLAGGTMTGATGGNPIAGGVNATQYLLNGLQQTSPAAALGCTQYSAAGDMSQASRSLH